MKAKIKKAKLRLKENKVKEVLATMGMSQQELADRIGTNRGHISKIANQRSPAISLPIAIKIAKELKMPVEELFIIETE
jgi:DNA-binding XRE family transcriptional regulator